MIYILHMENHFLNFFLIQVNLKSQVLLVLVNNDLLSACHERSHW